jgi:hypothetical protein
MSTAPVSPSVAVVSAMLRRGSGSTTAVGLLSELTVQALRKIALPARKPVIRNLMYRYIAMRPVCLRLRLELTHRAVKLSPAYDSASAVSGRHLW